MTEWPKSIKDAYEESDDCENEKVIPADLGHDLYKALRYFLDKTNYYTAEAIANYEREVGIDFPKSMYRRVTK